MKDKNLNKKEAFALTFMIPYVDGGNVFLKETMWVFENLNSNVARTAGELYATVAHMQEQIKQLKEDSMLLCHLKMGMNDAIENSDEILKNVSKSVSFVMEPTKLEGVVLGVFEILVYASAGQNEFKGPFFEKKDVDYLNSKLKVCFASLDSWGVSINRYSTERHILDLKTQDSDKVYSLLRSEINSRAERAPEFYANIEKMRLDREVETFTERAVDIFERQLPVSNEFGSSKESDAKSIKERKRKAIGL